MTITPATPSVSTTILDSSGGPITGLEGEKVYDTATVTGTPFTPTGTVTYNFYTTATPTYGVTTPSSKETVTLTSTGSVPNSATTAALAVGGYSYIAVYSGDGNYKSDTGPVEPLFINPTPPLVTTSIGGTVFCDCNNDGIQEPGEAGIPGVTLTLTGTDVTGPSRGPGHDHQQPGNIRFQLSLQPGHLHDYRVGTSGLLRGKERGRNSRRHGVGRL